MPPDALVFSRSPDPHCRRAAPRHNIKKVGGVDTAQSFGDFVIRIALFGEFGSIFVPCRALRTIVAGVVALIGEADSRYEA